MAEKDGEGSFTGKREELRDRNSRWLSNETEQRSLQNLRPFTSDYRPKNPGRRSTGLKKELLKVLNTRLASDPLKRRFVTLIAQAMVKAAAKGNVQAAQFIRDEVDGRLPKPGDAEMPAANIVVQVQTGVPRFPHYDFSKLPEDLKPGT
jgi:hypothetical protein